MSDHEPSSDSPASQFSIEDDEIIWHGPASDTDFIILRHPLVDTHTILSPDGDLSSTLDRLSLRDHCDSVSNGNNPSKNQVCTKKRARTARKTKPPVLSSESSSSDYESGTSTPIASYEDASAFITRFISSPIKGNDAQLSLLRALLIELGLRSPNSLDLPSTLTSARKVLKAEAHVNIKEYAATRHRGQSALRAILKPSKSALRKDIRKGNGASLQWVKKQGLQVLLVTCFT